MKSIKIIFSVVFVFLCILPVFSQGPPPATPIDGGLSLLLAAGGIYGIKKLKEKRKE